MWSRALSSPGRATGIANWVSSGSLVLNRPRSASAPFVLYKQKFTLQFDRQSSLLSQMMDEATAEDESEAFLPHNLFLEFAYEVRERRLNFT